MNYIDENLFVIALNKLVWINKNQKDYVEPIRKGKDIKSIWNREIPIHSIYGYPIVPLRHL